LWYTGLVPELYKRNPNVECLVCGKEIYRRPVELERSNHRAFCSSACYGKANRKETPCVVCSKMIMAGANKKTCSRACANIHRTGLKYRVGGSKSKVKSQKALRIRLLKARGQCCERCGYNKVGVLQVHHKNRNKHDNSLENLELICPNCHYEDHFLFGKKMVKN